MGQDIENMVTGVLSGVLERQTEKTIIALQGVIDQRITDMSKGILQVEKSASDDRASVQLCLHENREFRQLTTTIEKDIVALRLQLQALSELVAQCIEDVSGLQRGQQQLSVSWLEDVGSTPKDGGQNSRQLDAETPLAGEVQGKAFQAMLDQVQDVACCIDQATEHWACSLDVERQIRAAGLETCCDNVARLEEQLRAVRQQDSLTAAPARGLQQDRMQFELLAGAAAQMERWECALEMQAMSAGQRLGLAEEQLAQSYQREHSEMVSSMQHGVGQLESVMEGVARKENQRLEFRECAKGEQDALSIELKLQVPKLEERVDEMANHLMGVEELFVSNLDDMQQMVGQLSSKLAANSSKSLGQQVSSEISFQKEVLVRIDGMEEYWARRFDGEQQECRSAHQSISQEHPVFEALQQTAAACQDNAQFLEAELAAVWGSIAQQEAAREACSIRDCEQVSEIRNELASIELRTELESRELRSVQEAVSNFAAVGPEAQITRMHSIVKDLTRSIRDEMISRFDALQRSTDANSLCSRSDRRHPDPEPEPELVDLRRLEARQEESRQAMEEVQQQLGEIQRHDPKSGLLSRNLVLQESRVGRSLEREARVLKESPSQEKLVLDSTRLLTDLKSQLGSWLPTGAATIVALPTTAELHARQDLVSAEIARCNEAYQKNGTELSDMCRVLCDMDTKFGELSQLKPGAGGDVALDILQHRVDCMWAAFIPQESPSKALGHETGDNEKGYRLATMATTVWQEAAVSESSVVTLSSSTGEREQTLTGNAYL